MRESVLERMTEATLVIKAAAVADYRPVIVSEQKLKRTGPLMPVSYTHLDVYKRQRMTCTNLRRKSHAAPQWSGFVNGTCRDRAPNAACVVNGSRWIGELVQHERTGCRGSLRDDECRRSNKNQDRETTAPANLKQGFLPPGGASHNSPVSAVRIL